MNQSHVNTNRLFFRTPASNPRLPEGIKIDQPIPGAVEKHLLPSVDLEKLNAAPPKKLDLIELQRTYGDKFFFFSSNRLSLAVFDWEDLRQVLGPNSQSFAKGRIQSIIGSVAGWGLLTQEAEDHKTDRLALNPAFHRSAVTIYAKQTENVLDKWLGELTDPDGISLVSTVRKILYQSTVNGVFGLDDDVLDLNYEIYLDNLASYVAEGTYIGADQAPGYYNSYVKNRDLVIEHTMTLSKEMREQNSTEMTFGKILNDLYPGEIEIGVGLHGQVSTFIAAGTETTASIISSFISHFAQDLKSWRQARAEIVSGDKSSFEARMKEILRLYPPAPLIGRVALEDTRVGDLVVPAGTEIFVSPEATHRMGKYYENPDEYDHTRWLQGRDMSSVPYFPFGYGPRMCIGFATASATAELVLTKIFTELEPTQEQSAPALTHNFIVQSVPRDYRISLRSIKY